MESFENNTGSPLEALSDEKRASLDYQLNIGGESFDTLSNTISYYADEGESAKVDEINGLVAGFSQAELKEDEKRIARELVAAIG